MTALPVRPRRATTHGSAYYYDVVVVHCRRLQSINKVDLYVSVPARRARGKKQSGESWCSLASPYSVRLLFALLFFSFFFLVPFLSWKKARCWPRDWAPSPARVRCARLKAKIIIINNNLRLGTATASPNPCGRRVKSQSNRAREIGQSWPRPLFICFFLLRKLKKKKTIQFKFQ